MKKRGKKKGKRGSAMTDILPWLVLALLLLVIIIITLSILKKNNIDLIAQIRNLFRRT